MTKPDRGPRRFSRALADECEVAQLDRVIHEAPFGVYVDDPERGCVYANRALLDQFGVRWEDFAGFGWASFVHADDSAALQARVHEYELNPELIDVRYRVCRPDGDIRWIRARVEARLDESGRHVGSVGTTEDRTHVETLRNQTVEAQKLQAVGRLAGGVAHDFNNLMGAIIGSADLLEIELDDERRDDHLATIRRAVEQGRQVTQKLLLVARQQRLGAGVCCADEELRGLQPLLERTLGPQLEVSVETSGSACHVGLDSGQFGQLVLNLASNGADAMGGCGTLVLRTRLEPPHVIVEVEDEGTGMDESTRAKMFSPFFTTKGPDGGTGLGAWIVKDLVEMVEGRIEVHSRLGEGTLVRLSLPQIKPSAESTSARGRPDDELRGGERVLLVEDHDGLRQSLGYGLSMYGYPVDVATTIEQAREMLEKNEYEAVVCDVLLPDGNGPDLGREVRVSGDATPWLYISGFSGSADVADELKRPATAFLAKPFEPRDIVVRLRDLIDAR